MKLMPENSRPESPEEPPPVLGRWPRVYAAVLLYLAALITVFYIFGAVFTP